MKRALLFLLLPLMTSCLYKMPEEDYIELRPTTNNPNIIRQTPDSIPGMGM